MEDFKAICEITFVINRNRTISSIYNFDSDFFRSKEVAARVLEGIHYDFLHRMKEEGLVNFEIELNS